MAVNQRALADNERTVVELLDQIDEHTAEVELMMWDHRDKREHAADGDKDDDDDCAGITQYEAIGAAFHGITQGREEFAPGLDVLALDNWSPFALRVSRHLLAVGLLLARLEKQLRDADRKKHLARFRLFIDRYDALWEGHHPPNPFGVN